MAKLDTLLWITMGITLVLFLPLGLVLLAYIILRTIGQMMNKTQPEEEETYEQNELSPKALEQGR